MTAMTPSPSARRPRSLDAFCGDQGRRLASQGIILKHREMLISQRTQAINPLRCDAAEFGVAVQGTSKVTALMVTVARPHSVELGLR